MSRLGMALAAGAALLAAGAAAERRAVLGQIDLPHNYYFREMYLPQLTSGPASVAFTPDGKALIYSMQGYLWRQAIDSTLAEQLTNGPGYDYQPDVSHDGTRVVFARYANDAVELWQLDLATRTTQALTANHAVNLEPRYSPQDSRLAWVSTAGTGHLHVFVGDLADGGLQGRAVWPERKSAAPRYYYSAFDHEISPAWSPDGKELVYIGNPEIEYGTGPIWRRALDRTAEPRLVRSEETTWRARPDWAADGQRIVYASYAGRAWHQLWMTTPAGGDPIALGYGDFDATNARWSPDSRRIAYISNQTGDTQIHLIDIPGARDRALKIGSRRYVGARGELSVRVLDERGAPVAARVAVVGADGRGYAPDDAWMHADDGFDRARSAFEQHYFHTAGESKLNLPPQMVRLTVWRGLEYAVEHREFKVAPGASTSVEVRLKPLDVPAGWREAWKSADVHVHMNYGGTYRTTPARLVAQAAAEHLPFVFDLIVNKEQRVPDIEYFSPLPDAASNAAVVLTHSQEYHTSYWGHLGLLGLQDHVLLPAFAAYRNTAAASLVPTNADIADLAHDQMALVGYVHPFDEIPDPKKDASLSNELPVDVALGKVDYYEVVGFADHQSSAAVWHRLLNCGFRPAAAAGTDAMANFASLRGPVGMNRVFVNGGEATGGAVARVGSWLGALKAGRSLATNSALLGLAVDGAEPGSEVDIGEHGIDLALSGFMRSIVAMDHLEVLQNGRVVRRIDLGGDRRSADLKLTVHASEPGWLLLRAWNEHADPDVFDIYPYATTNPVFLVRRGAATHCGADADYFIEWIDRLAAAARTHPGYHDASEKRATLEQIAAARGQFESRR